MSNSAKIIVGDNRETLKTLEAGSFQTCVTSPPYWGLRDYGNDNQIGLEQTPAEFVEQLCLVFDEVWRVLADDGTLWLNLGDSYASFRDGKATPDTTRGDSVGTLVPKGSAANRMASSFSNSPIKHKDLVGIPWRVAFALQERGWYLRSEIIWHKPNPMPESVTDRPTKSHEHIFLLTKQPKYFYDSEAIKEPSAGLGETNIRFGGSKYGDSDDPKHATKSGNTYVDSGLRNKRDVWSVTTKPYKGAHFATYPIDLVEPCILAGTSEYGHCVECGKGWVRLVERERKARNELDPSDSRYRPNTYHGAYADINGKGDAGYTFTSTLGWEKGCECKTSDVRPAIVLDPFSGSGTTGIAALTHGRNYVGLELNPEYAEISRCRLIEFAGLFGEVNVVNG